MLTAQSISLKFGYVPVLKGLEASFEPGQPHLIQGDNGTGKTTLLRIFAGDLKPTAGKLLWHEQNIRLSHPWRQRVAWVGGSAQGYDVLTVEENLKAFASLRNITVTDHWLNQQLERFNLQEYRTERLKHLSRGWLQRVKITLATLGEPQLYLFDEAFEGLDKDSQSSLAEWLLSLSKQKLVIFVSHHPPAALVSSSKLWTLKQGRLQ